MPNNYEESSESSALKKDEIKLSDGPESPVEITRKAAGQIGAALGLERFTDDLGDNTKAARVQTEH